MNQIKVALSSVVQALSKIYSYGLLRYYFYAGGLAFILFFGIIASSWIFGDDLGRLVLKNIPWIKDWIGSGADWFGRVFTIVLGVLLFKYILLLAVSPIMSLLSERIERKVLGDLLQQPPAMISSLKRGSQLALRNMSRELIITAILLIVSLFPAIAIISAPAIFLVQSYYAGFGNMDFFLERRLNKKDTVPFVRKHRLFALINGAVFMGLLLIPIVGVFLAPGISTSAATIGLLELEGKEKGTL